MPKLVTLMIVSSLFFLLNACQLKPPISANEILSAHPLLDKIWSVKEQQFINLASLQKRMVAQDYIFLGETHDNARHHQLQAQFIHHLSSKNKSLSVAFEMLNKNQQTIIDHFTAHYYANNSSNNTIKTTAEITDIFAREINWQQSGWPEWSYYRPIFYQTLQAQAQIIAANLSLKQIRQLIKKGRQTLNDDYQQLLDKYHYDKITEARLLQEVQAAHCNMLPESMLSPMLMAQQVRDLAMMRAIQPSEQSLHSQTLLIAGSGHTRTDYGIPFYLNQEYPLLKKSSIAFIEVSDDKPLVSDYAQVWGETNKQLPFDYVWFTHRAERKDPCKKMKLHMQKKANSVKPSK